MKTSSRKSKGRALQNFVAERLRLVYAPSGLEADDVKPAIMGESGVDIKLSPSAKRLIVWDVECKNVEKLNVWQAWNQAVSNTEAGRRSLLVFKRNRQEPLVVMSWKSFEEVVL